MSVDKFHASPPLHLEKQMHFVDLYLYSGVIQACCRD